MLHKPVKLVQDNLLNRERHVFKVLAGIGVAMIGIAPRELSLCRPINKIELS
jgi:hypothetical protein